MTRVLCMLTLSILVSQTLTATGIGPSEHPSLCLCGKKWRRVAAQLSKAQSPGCMVGRAIWHIQWVHSKVNQHLYRWGLPHVFSECTSGKITCFCNPTPNIPGCVASARTPDFSLVTYIKYSFLLQRADVSLDESMHIKCLKQSWYTKCTE